LTCLGKIVGGGLPVGAFGGRREIMEMLAPAGPVYQAGTLSGNPLAVAAGLAVLKILKDGNPYEDLDRKTAALCGDLSRVFEEGGIPVAINRAGSMFTVFFQPGEVRDFSTASKSDTVRFSRFFRAMAANGVLLPPSQFEAAFLSIAHGKEETERTLEACRRAARTL
ncbi:MAG TPA: aminotransferase class III-fold pyridoxal phosphate-dependent enzyme, partial [Syntrophales bacterium]|nr:aminotransferase class III-fold pyridoxal phosphate-dependent enzyme [Syntrophales bacterium]